MTTLFLVERYWPALTVESVSDASSNLLDAGVRVVDTIVATADEICLWLVEANSAAEVATAFHEADMPQDRISSAVRI